MSCFDCNGSGYVDAAREKRCPRCNGSGDADRPMESGAERNERILHEFTVSLPMSNESFGRWLEENGASVSISCQLGTYNVRVNYHELGSYKESGNVSVTRSSDTEVSAHGKSFAMALALAMSGSHRP